MELRNRIAHSLGAPGLGKSDPFVLGYVDLTSIGPEGGKHYGTRSCSVTLTHAKNTICLRGSEEASDIIHAEGVRGEVSAIRAQGP